MNNIYVDISGKEIMTENNQVIDKSWSYNLKEDTIEDISLIIRNTLINKNAMMCNIQISEECSQYDILFTLNRVNQGYFQGGIRSQNLIISIMKKGAFGFNIGKSDTSEGYYEEKIGVYSKLLTKLFNKIREDLID